MYADHIIVKRLRDDWRAFFDGEAQIEFDGFTPAAAVDRPVSLVSNAIASRSVRGDDAG